jgi:hypothetical protein
MTALEYMEREARLYRFSYNIGLARGVSEEQLNKIKVKISYYEQAVEALRMENILLNESGEVDFDYESENDNG